MTALLRDVPLAYDDSGKDGDLVLMLPSAGDVRSENRFLATRIQDAGYRVITADLPGHGDSPPASQYSVRSTASAIIDLIESIDAGPAVVIGASFAPAAAVWAAAERPDLIQGVVAISPHFHADSSMRGLIQRMAIKLLLRGPWAASIWSKLYVGWYKSQIPVDLSSELERIRQMLADPERRRAVRKTLVADRGGVMERMTHLSKPTLTIFGSADDHFEAPASEAAAVATTLKGAYLLVEGAGHYPHVERPYEVAEAIIAFLESVD